MKTTFQNLIRFTVILCLAYVSVPQQALAQAADYTYTTNNGTITITGYTGPGGAVTIPDSIDGLPVTSIGDWAFSHNFSLTTVTIPDSVSSIGESAFSTCTSLTSVTIFDGVMSIGFSGFANCSRLAIVTIGNSVTNIGGSAFSNCGALTNVTIPASVTSIDNSAFSGCTSLTAIDVVPQNPIFGSADGVLLNKSQTTLIFCPGGKSGNYVIPNSVITIANGAFSYCRALTSVTIPDSVTSIGSYAFLGCTSLTSVTIPDSVTTIEHEAFRDCTSLTNVTIPNSVTNIGGGVFFDCISLTNVTIPNNVTTIEDGTFSGTSLSRVTIPNNVTSIGQYPFAGCTSLTSISIPNTVTSIGVSSFAGCTSLSNVTIPNSVASVGDSAFAGCSSLTAITVDSGNPNYSSLDGVLFNKSQTSIIQCPGGKVGSYTVPNSVTNIVAWAFYDCSSLTAIEVDSVNPNYSSVDGVLFDKSQTTIIQCPGGKAGSFTIPNSVSVIWWSAFSGCTSLTAITVDDLNSTYSSVDGVLFDKNTITLIECPEGKAGSYTIPSKVTTIGYDAFSGCTSLTSISIPNSVTNIEYTAFWDCTSLTNFTVDPVNTTYSSVDGILFNKSQTSIVQCPGGRAGSYTVPSNVTSIRWYAFKDCTSLTRVTIPNSVTSIVATKVCETRPRANPDLDGGNA